MHERTDEAFELDERLTVVGKQLLPGEMAPDFLLDYFDANASRIYQMSLADSTGTVRLLNVVNSLDTPVCQVETRRWEQLAQELPPDVQVYTISMDLPFAQSRWQVAEGVTHRVLSSHRSDRFGEDYGGLLKERRLLTADALGLRLAGPTLPRVHWCAHREDTPRAPQRPGQAP